MLFTEIPLQKGKYFGKSLEVKLSPERKGPESIAYEREEGERRTREVQGAGKGQRDGRGHA